MNCPLYFRRGRRRYLPNAALVPRLLIAGSVNVFALLCKTARAYQSRLSGVSCRSTALRSASM
jgi:hypothetical protein